MDSNDKSKGGGSAPKKQREHTDGSMRKPVNTLENGHSIATVSYKDQHDWPAKSIVARGTSEEGRASRETEIFKMVSATWRDTI